jgi:hypothetical protein
MPITPAFLSSSAAFQSFSMPGNPSHRPFPQPCLADAFFQMLRSITGAGLL